MNELERQLTQALSALSEQYAQDMKRLEEQNIYLHQEVTDLSQQVQTLSSQLNRLETFLKSLSAAITGAQSK